MSQNFISHRRVSAKCARAAERRQRRSRHGRRCEGNFHRASADRLQTTTPSRVTTGSYQDAVARFRRDLIEKSLLETEGNQNRAAALLNISRQALAYQIRELGILVRKRPAPPL